jgi:predicted transcriptional regulator
MRVHAAVSRYLLEKRNAHGKQGQQGQLSKAIERERERAYLHLQRERETETETEVRCCLVVRLGV